MDNDDVGGSRTIDDTDSSRVRPEEMDVARAWVDRLIGATRPPTGAPTPDAATHDSATQGSTTHKVASPDPASPDPAPRHTPDAPFSFACGARSSRAWLSLADAEGDHGDWQQGRRRHDRRWRDPETSLSCALELTEFEAFPALEWVLRLRNDGDTDTAPITDLRALDIFWNRAAGDETPELLRALGSDGRRDDFQLVREDLRQSMWDAAGTVRMDAATNTAFRRARNGSPSFLMGDSRPSATWLPFFHLRTGGDGLLCALGWSGRWFAEVAHDGQGRTEIRAGMEHLELPLEPGEEIRSPRVLLMPWQGTVLHAQNLLRRFLLTHHSPHVDGHPVQAPICNGAWGGTPTPGHLAVIDAIERHGLPYDVYWVDAGWYGTSTKPCPDVFHGDWGITGDWRVNTTYHPDGLTPISEAAHRAGMKFLLWLEPERAKYGTPVTRQHPEWFLRRTDDAPQPNEDLLLNLGHPGAWQWVVDTVSGLITDNGIDWYREDFNIDPAPFWDHADTTGRRGLTEMRFVEGLYAFWDELRRRHPGLLIDNCASGGRRLELELLGRSVALWRTDYNCFPYMDADASQVHGAGLNRWLPLHATSPFTRPGDTYQVRSAYSAGLVLNLEEFGMRDCHAADFPWDWYRQRLEEARRLRPCFLGDFYPLTPGTFDPEAWLAYQLLVPDTHDGAVLAFRRAASPMTEARFQLRGLDAAATYALEDADSGHTWQGAGAELLSAGLTIAIDTPRASRLLFCRRLEPAAGEPAAS